MITDETNNDYSFFDNPIAKATEEVITAKTSVITKVKNAPSR